MLRPVSLPAARTVTRSMDWSPPKSLATEPPCPAPAPLVPLATRPLPAWRRQLVGNGILDSLPDAERIALDPFMRRASVTTRQVVFEAGQAIDTVYFPVSGAISLVTVTDGSQVTVASVGREGVAGLPVFLGEPSSVNVRAVAQMPGAGICIPARPFRHAARTPGTLQDLLAHAASAFITQVAQEVACNRRHSALERCSRWLLITADRCGSSQFPLTQQFLAELLGTRRASVVAVARTLQEAGVIRYGRGHIRVADRAGLERFACPCYPVICRALGTDGQGGSLPGTPPASA